jgi:hypothetical protein
MLAEDMRARDAGEAINPRTGEISRFTDAFAAQHIPVKRDHAGDVFCD